MSAFPYYHVCILIAVAVGIQKIKKKKSNLKIKKQFRVDSCEQFQSTESLISLHSSNVLF